MRQGLPWQHSVTLRSVIDKNRHNRCRLLQILFRETLISVEIGVDTASLIIARILNELEPGQSDLVERDVIGGSRIAQRDGRESQIADRGNPLLKDRSNGRIPFSKNAEKLASPEVSIEIGVELGVLGLDGNRASLLAQEFGNDLLLGLGGIRPRAKVSAHVSAGTEQTLLFAAPQGDTYRAARLYAHGAKNAHRLKRDDRSGAVVGRSRARDPGVEMASQHHDLIS